MENNLLRGYIVFVEYAICYLETSLMDAHHAAFLRRILGNELMLFSLAKEK